MSSKSRKKSDLLRNGLVGKFQHHIEPSHNVFLNQRPKPSKTQALADREKKQTIFKSSHPSPLYTAKDPIPIEDYPLKLVEKKLAYTTELQRLKALTLRNTNKHKQKSRIKDKHAVDTKYFQQYAEWLECDPDPHFTGVVNWYFTGGTTKSVTLDDRELVCHTSGPELNELVISEIVYQNTGPTLKETTNGFQSFTRNDPIYELLSVKPASQLMIRQRHAIRLVNLDQHNNNPATDVTLTSAEIPFISCAYNAAYNRLSTVDTESNLIRWHLIEASEPLAVQKCQLEKLEAGSDNWNCLRAYDDDDTICHTDRRRVHLFDGHEKIDPKRPAFQYDFTSILAHCEELTCMERSRNSNIVYIGTTHSVLAVDFRYVNSANLQLLKWKHHLKTPSLMLDIIGGVNNSTEVIAVGGTMCGDVRIFEAIDTDTAVHSSRLLYKPLSLSDTYSLARKYGHCLSPMSCVRRQTELSSVGLSFVGTGTVTDMHHLMTQNSAGNIFVQRITNEHISDDAVSTAESIGVWDEHLMEHSRAESQPFATTLTNFRSMHGALRFDPKLDEAVTEPIPSRPRQKWQQSVDELRSYTDLLTKDILALWDLSDQHDSRPKTPPIDSTANVQNWLFQSEIAAANEKVQLPEISAQTVMEELPDLLEVSQSKRPSKPKRKYVPGF